MAGGQFWTREEDAYIVEAMAAGKKTDAIYTEGLAAGVWLPTRTTSAIKSRRAVLYGRTGKSEKARAQQQTAKIEVQQAAIDRALSGEWVPGLNFTDWRQPQQVGWRDWFGQFETALDYHRKVDPHQEILTVDLRHAEAPVNLAFGADFHLGGGFTSHSSIRETMEFLLETEGLYLALVGDIIEGFIPGEKSAETVEQMAGSLTAQLSAMKSLVHELCTRDKLLCLSWGDHDAKWFEKMIGLNIVKREFHDRVPYFTGRGLMRLLVGEQEYYVQVNHSAAGSSVVSDNAAERKMHQNFFPADVNVSAHRHRPAFQMMHHYEQLREAGLNIGGKTWLVKCGTFKTGTDPYTIRNWRKGIMGVPTAVFQTAQHDVDILEGPEKAEAFRRGLTK